MEKINSGKLNLAAFHPGTRALGPGLRAVIWVQGCPFSCKGCIAPDWIPFRRANLVDPLRLAEEILSLPDINGITISGGEPMIQSQALSTLLSAILHKKQLSVIVFSGFTLEKLQKNPPNPSVKEFLILIDILIDGLYVEKLNNGRGLHGSSNQKFHYLTNKLKSFDLSEQSRDVELYFQGNESFLVGVPSPDFYQAYNKAFQTNKEVEGPDERS